MRERERVEQAMEFVRQTPSIPARLGFQELQLEVLLDIRDLLVNQPVTGGFRGQKAMLAARVAARVGRRFIAGTDTLATFAPFAAQRTAVAAWIESWIVEAFDEETRA